MILQLQGGSLLINPEVLDWTDPGAENYIVFALLSMKIDFLEMPKLMLRQQPLAMGAEFLDDEEGIFYVVDRKTGELKKRAKAPPNMSFHVLNAYEEDNKVSFRLSEKL